MVNTAAYKYDISPHQALYIGSKGLMTIVTVQSTHPGQQQQASHQFSTGKWTAVPLLYALGHLVVVVIVTAQGTYYLQVQGGQTQMSAGPLSEDLEALISKAQPSTMQALADMPEDMPAVSMPPMRPMQPMQPMQMGMNPMSMSLGNMAMSMGTAASTSSTASASEVSSRASETSSSETSEQTVKRFCSQCGSGIEPSDRFCAYCGNRLQ